MENKTVQPPVVKGGKEDKDNKDTVVKPDPETLHTTDPQDHMEGPVSSIVQDIRKEADNTNQKKDI